MKKLEIHVDVYTLTFSSKLVVKMHWHQNTASEYNIILDMDIPFFVW